MPAQSCPVPAQTPIGPVQTPVGRQSERPSESAEQSGGLLGDLSPGQLDVSLLCGGRTHGEAQDVGVAQLGRHHVDPAGGVNLLQ